MEKCLAILDCPMVFEGENPLGMSSMGLCPSLGIAPGLISRHVRVVEGQLVCVSIWQSLFCCRSFHDAAWKQRAGTLFQSSYRLRIEEITEASGAA